jgi:pyrroloquinoline quinone biosynthesis protein D
MADHPLLSLDPSQRPTLASHVRLQMDPVTGDPVLLFPEGLLVLNATAHEIVRRCDGQTSIAEMIRQLTDEFDAGEETVRNDILENLTQLRHRNLILFPK